MMRLLKKFIFAKEKKFNFHMKLNYYNIIKKFYVKNLG